MTRQPLPLALVVCAAAVLGAAPAARAAAIPSPSEFLGLSVGADRTLADYRQVRKYFDALAAASPRVEVEVLGKTTLGEELFMAVISSERNVAAKKRLQDVARRLADPRGLPAAEAERLVSEGKVVLLITCNIHSTEIGASQMAMEWAHALATRAGRAHEEVARRRRAAAAAVDQPRRPDHGDRVVPQEPRDEVRGRADAVAVPPLHRATTTTATGSC